jgi:hypothetical protein
MADTVWYNSNGVSVPYDSLPDSVRQTIEQVRHDGYLDTPVEKHDDGSYTPFILVMSIVVIAAFIGVKRAWKENGTVLLGSGSSRRTSIADQRSQGLQDQLHREYNVYEGRDIVIPDEQ